MLQEDYLADEDIFIDAMAGVRNALLKHLTWEWDWSTVSIAQAAAGRNSELAQACVSWLGQSLFAAQIGKAEGKKGSCSFLPFLLGG